MIIVYRQPHDPEGKHRSGSKEFKNLLNELNAAISNLPSPTPDVLLCGDFNLPHAVWSNGTCSTGATRDEQCMVGDLYSLANEHFMMQVIDRPTHRSGNTLDLMFTNNANYIYSYSSNITALSDHFLVQCQVAYADSDINNDTITSDKEEDEELSFRDYNFFVEDIDWNCITDTLSKVDWRLCFHKSTPEQMMETFLSVCLEIVKEVIPLKRQSNWGHETSQLSGCVVVVTMLQNTISALQMITSPIAVQQIVKRPEIWDAMTLMWRHCKDNAEKTWILKRQTHTSAWVIS